MTWGRTHVDVLVAGAGPAGSVAALELARAGFSVCVADRLTSTAPKIGEVLPGAAIRLLGRLNLSSDIAIGDDGGHCRVGGSLTAWGGGAMIAADAIADPYGASIRLDRARFDAALRRAGSAEGVSFHAADVAALERQGDRWAVSLDDGDEVSASWSVDATGRRCKIARLLGIPRQRGPALVAVYRRGVPARNAAIDRTVIETRPEGWFYGGRLGDGRWAFGLHTSPDEARRLRREPARWHALFRQAPRLADLLGDPVFDPGMIVRDARGARLSSPVGDRWLACGDAAICFDPVAGQGLFNALRSGMAAARHIVSANGGRGTDEYAAELADVAAIYDERRRTLYGERLHLPDTPFWQSQRFIRRR